MKSHYRRLVLSFVAAILCSCGGGGQPSHGPGFPVTTWHYNNARTGANGNETILNLANVNPNTFGKLFDIPADGAVVGQVLYLPNVSIAGKGTHNVVYAATMHDSVYAFDAESNTGANANPLWQVSLLPSGATPVPMTVQGCSGVTAWTEVGIVATPVIDSATGTIYVVAKTYESGNTVFRLHALDVTPSSRAVGVLVGVETQDLVLGHADRQLVEAGLAPDHRAAATS